MRFCEQGLTGIRKIDPKPATIAKNGARTTKTGHSLVKLVYDIPTGAILRHREALIDLSVLSLLALMEIFSILSPMRFDQGLAWPKRIKFRVLGMDNPGFSGLLWLG